MSASQLFTTNQVFANANSLTASTESTGYAATNLASPKRTATWRSCTTTADCWVECYFCSTQASITAMHAINATIPSGWTLTPQYSTSTGGAYTTFGSAYTVPSSNRTRMLSQFGTATFVQRVRWYFTASSSAHYAELGVGWAGTGVTPTANVKSDPQFALNDPSVVRYAEGGQRHAWTRQTFVTVGLNYSPVTSSDRDTLLQQFDAVGTHDPAVLALDPSNQDFIFYGYFPAAVTYAPVGDDARSWRIDLSFEEAR